MIEAANIAEIATEGITARFFDDLQTLDRIAERYALPSSLLAYAQINLFTNRFDLSWLVATDGV